MFVLDWSITLVGILGKVCIRLVHNADRDIRYSLY